MKAIILSIGDELVLGQKVNTNASWLSSHLARHGILTLYHKILPDELNSLVRAIKQASEEAELVVLTGGLGPTEDDLTRQALSELIQAPLVLHQHSLERIIAFLKKRGRGMPLSIRTQAMYPQGAEVLENQYGTATGIKLQFAKAIIIALPGVPYEMKAMFEKEIIPLFPAKPDSFILTRTVNIFGLSEAEAAERLGKLMQRSRNPLVGITVSEGIVSACIRSDFSTQSIAQSELEKTAGQIRSLLGITVFGEGTDTLQEVVGSLLLERGKTVVTAESCTGGLVGKLLTDRPGASVYYKGGWIVYSNELKIKQLGMPLDMLKREGAVSEQVVRYMAEQAVKLSSTDYALALSGIAGPSGETQEKPVGTIWIALASCKANKVKSLAQQYCFHGTRQQIRDRAAKTALNILRLELTRNYATPGTNN